MAKGKKTGGRTTLLTAALAEKICGFIGATGCTFEGAAAAAGVTPRSLYGWNARGQIETSGVYFQFAQDLARARARSEASLAGIISQAAKQDWRAAAFILERRFPDSWGNRLALVRQLERMTDGELDDFITREIAESLSASENSHSRTGTPEEADPVRSTSR